MWREMSPDLDFENQMKISGRSFQEKQNPHAKNQCSGVPIIAQWKLIWPAFVRTQVWSLASLTGLRIWCCCKLWYRCRCSSDPTLLWLWYRPVSRAPIWPLAWEPPFAAGAAIKRQKKKKKKKRINVVTIRYKDMAYMKVKHCRKQSFKHGKSHLH